MSKIVAALSVVAIVMLTGCFAPNSGDEGDSSAAGDPGTSRSSEQGDGTTADNEPGENEADENEADGSGDEEGDGSDESEDDPAPTSGPCDAVVPFEDVSGLIHDPSAVAMTTVMSPKESLPGPPPIRSLPAPPSIVSAPRPPLMVSWPLMPKSRSPPR